MSNLLKQCYVVNSGTGTRIINSNERVWQRLQEIGKDADTEASRQTENGQEGTVSEFAEGIEAQPVRVDTEAIRQEIIDKASAEADEILSTAKEDAQRIRTDAEQQAEALLEETKKQGYEEGAKVREAELNQQHEEAMASIQEQKAQLQEQYETKLSTMEADIVDAVIQVFDKVFRIQFEDKRELLLHLVNGTLMDIDSGDKIRIHTNRDDEAMLKEHLSQMQEIVGNDVSIEFVKDNKLSDGQCKIETPYGMVDCGIDTQLSALLKDIRSLV